jgi:predicted kinase
MLQKLFDASLQYIIGMTVHKVEKLTATECTVQQNYMSKLQIKKRTTKRPIIVAMVGLVGSGKSTVANDIAMLIDATVINGDEIRLGLRKQAKSYEKVRLIAENMAIEIIKNGGNAVLDSDFIDAKKRASIREKAKQAGAEVVFVRTYADPDIVLGRIATAETDEFFAGAKTEWEGDKQSKSAVVKIRELWRRTPLHYRWEATGGGKWILKKLPFLSADIDTGKDYKKLLREALKLL